jgi:DNA-binding PadR family transcriptional regulator
VGKPNLSRLISRQSSELFQLGDLEQHLLAWISSGGENTIYGLEKLAREHNRVARAKSQHPLKTSHATISRTIKDLLDRDYIMVSREQPYRTRQNKKYYNVTTKGYLAALAAISIDQTYAVRSLHPILAKLTTNSDLARVTMLLFKTCLSAWFQWHILNGLILSGLTDAKNYRLSSSQTTLSGEVPNHSSDLYTNEPTNNLSDEKRGQIFDQILLDCLKETIQMWGQRADTRSRKTEQDLLDALGGLNLILGTRIVTLLSQEKALGLALMINIYRDCFERAHERLTELDLMKPRGNYEEGQMAEVHDTELGIEFAQATGGWESLEGELRRFRENLWGIGYFESYSPLPEREIVQLYDFELKQLLE